MQQCAKFFLTVTLAILIVVSIFTGLTLLSKHTRSIIIATPTPIPFDYSLKTATNSCYTTQGDDIKLEVNVTYLQGEPENITLKIQGAPDNLAFSFSQASNITNNVIGYTLMLHAPLSVPTNKYHMLITAISVKGIVRTAPLDLSVNCYYVIVKGSVTTNPDIIPTQIQFEELSPQGNTVQTFKAPVESGNFSIKLVNEQYYAVSVFWDRNGLSGVNHFNLPWGALADVGVDTLTVPFEFTYSAALMNKLNIG